MSHFRGFEHYQGSGGVMVSLSSSLQDHVIAFGLDLVDGCVLVVLLM